jgi:Tfp pilus assembly protein PilE
MGQQQLLLIVLGVIIVGIAVVVGINVFTAQNTNSNRDAVTSDLTQLAAQAQQYYKKPTALGGGGNAFTSWTIPSNMKKNPNGSYTATVSSATSVTLIGKGTTTLTAGGTDTVQVTMVVGPDAITSTTVNK